MQRDARKTCMRWLRATVVSVLVSAPVWADDSDIYTLTGKAYNDGILRVMLTLDARSNAGSTLCTNGDTGEECDYLWGGRGEDSLLIKHVDMFNAQGQLLADGYADIYQPPADSAIVWDPDAYPYLNLDESVADRYWPDSKVELFDAIRTVVRASLEKVAGVARANLDKIGGLEVGLMVSHGDSCSPKEGPGEDLSKCSSGAYVLQGFTDILDEEGLGLETIYRKIGALRYSETEWDGKSANFSGHSYNLRDIYLEYFQYITGGNAYSAFFGYDDYNSSMPDGDLYHTAATDPANDVLIANPYDPDEPGLPLLSPDLDRPGLDRPYEDSPLVWDHDNFQKDGNDIRGGTYRSPLSPTEECSSLFMVHTMFGDTNPSRQATDDALEAAGLGIEYQGNAQNTNDQEVISRFYQNDLGSTDFLDDDVAGEQNLTSYFLTKSGHSSIKSDENLMAKAGGTGRAYPLDDPQEMLATWDFIWGEILSVSTTFVAASVPVNVFDRSQTVNSLYFAIFQAENEVRWNGNVKKLKIVTVNDPFEADYDPTKPTFDMIAQNTNPPTPGISPADGRIRTDALTFWTDPAGADVVAFDPDPLSGEVSGKDGRSITRGGAGQKVPGYLTDTVGEHNGAGGARQVFTEDPATNALLGLDARSDAASGTAMPELSSYLDPDGSLSTDDERALIGWIRGLENVLDNSNPDASRDWLISDPMHSRPLVLNYGISGGNYTKENPDIRLFYGTNDGVFHVMKNTEDDGSESGKEVFAFVPLELLEMQVTLEANGQQAVEPHLYGMDGEAVAYVVDADGDGNIVSGDQSDDSVWVYIGMRRGGKALYAFDMTDPDAPVFKWKITSDMADFKQLGMTFSRPFATEIDLDGDGVATPVLIFAGGYNGGWKKDGTTDRIGKDIVGNRGADSIGNAIYVVDADTGALVWKAVGPGADDDLAEGDTLFRHAEMKHSIPSSISLLDTDGNDLVDRGYVGDTGGNIWRIELVEATKAADNTVTGGPQDWYVTRLAKLATTPDPDPEVGDIRFFHGPDVVQTRDDDGDYDAVVIASGNRADPLGEVVENFLYTIKDREITTRSGLSDRDILPSALFDVTDVCISGAEDACVAADLGDGWKLKLEATGEKGLSKPLTANGIVFLTTYAPSVGDENICGPSEGSGFAYLINLNNGSVRFNLDQDADQDRDKADRFADIGPGIPGDVIVLDSERLLLPGKGVDAERFDDDGDDDDDDGCTDQFCRPGGQSLWRIYWREEGVDRL